MADTPDMPPINPMENGANGPNGTDELGDEGEFNGVPFLIGAQYIKDLSFENPRGIETLSAIQENPDVSVDVSTNARAIGEEGMYEVLVFIRAEATVDDAPVFIVELTYGGVVQVAGVAEDEVKPIDFQTLYIEQHVDSDGSDI